MSNYTKVTDFEAKDSLPTADPAKVIKGTEFEVEFDAIATAIATKANSASPTFTGTATFSGATISDLGTVTTVDINGGTIDGAAIGSSSASTVNTTSLSLNGVAVTATAAELNTLDGITATVTELNKLDGVTATTAELNFVDGVTSNIQTQIDAKIAGNETITLSGDASGSGTTAITVVVADDSHSHTGTTISALDAGDTTTGTFADARISQSSVTQHEAAIDAGSVDGYDVSVLSQAAYDALTPDANTVYFIT